MGAGGCYLLDWLLVSEPEFLVRQTSCSKTDFKVISRSRDSPQKLDRFKRTQMGKGRPQKDNKEGLRKIAKLKDQDLEKD